MQQFQRNNGLPNCIGVIDGSHIPIKAPRDSPQPYVNRNVQLQAVCDGEKLFNDVYCGYPRSVHDARVLRNSPLYQDAEKREPDTVCSLIILILLVIQHMPLQPGSLQVLKIMVNLQNSNETSTTI